VIYPILSSIFFLTIFIFFLILVVLVVRPLFWIKYKRTILASISVWVIIYAIFIFFFTGPVDLNQYPTAVNSPYRLPWKSGVKRFVAQGNRSFISHRGLHLIAWDFVMPVGTPVLAAREGIVVHVEVDHDGIGLLANYIVIEHGDGIRTAYAHLKKDGALVKEGDQVKQGQSIGLSGIVGQTLFPHLHFSVTSDKGTLPAPISFKEVPGGVPFAGHFYTSENTEQ
jgi:energy-coupling factor transporter transmembrane protein EcfT